MDENDVYKQNANTIDELVARIMNSAALIKQERQDDLRRTTPTIAKRVEKCIFFTLISNQETSLHRFLWANVLSQLAVV